MDLRLKFNEDAENYDKWRPTYVPELFDEIISYSGIDETKKTLEIGIGTGQATLPFLQAKCKVTAIELIKKDCKKIENTIKSYGFKNCYSKLFFQTRIFTADGYISLLNTYSDHRAMPIKAKTALENGIADAINSFGGILHVYDTMDLYLARKP